MHFKNSFQEDPSYYKKSHEKQNFGTVKKKISSESKHQDSEKQQLASKHFLAWGREQVWGRDLEEKEFPLPALPHALDAEATS